MPGSAQALHAAGHYARLAAGLTHYQCSPIPADPAEVIREQMRHREENFLLMARHVLDRPGNLYRTLFNLAGCCYADLERGVKRDGLRATLDALLEAGVFVRHAEFRGKEPVVRGGREIPWTPDDMASPWGKGIIEQSSSGSTGARFPTFVGTKLLRHREAYEAVSMREFPSAQCPRLLATSILPSVWPFRHLISWHRLRSPVRRWFALGLDASRAWHYAAATRYLVAQMRLLGGRAPFPEFLKDNDFTPAAECLARFRDAGTPAIVRASPSTATRIAAAALEKGIGISGTRFAVSGEPLSDAKRSVMESAGARVFSQYHTSDFGVFGYACRKMTSGNCVHLFQDALMVVTRPREEPDQNALFATNLLPYSPRILINVEVDDCAVVEPARCDCEYSRLGFDLQIRDIFSYGKITGQGITMEAMDLLRLLEVDLPARFGGSPGDYQLAEVEGRAQTEMVLRISPRACVFSRDEVRAYFLEQVSRLYGGHLSVRMWTFTGGVRAAIEEPEVGLSGKVHPLRLRGAGRKQKGMAAGVSTQ